jgi:hypothetical protein
MAHTMSAFFARETDPPAKAARQRHEASGVTPGPSSSAARGSGGRFSAIFLSFPLPCFRAGGKIAYFPQTGGVQP